MKIEHPPLEVFTFQFIFPTLKSIPIEQISTLTKVFEEKYPKKPEIVLLQSSPVKLPSTFELTPPSPMRFTSEDNTRSIHIFSDKILFRFTKYENWNEARDEIMSVWMNLTDVLTITNFNLYIAEYINIFRLEREDFQLKNYFNLNVRHPSSWELNFEDFHLGTRFLFDEDEIFIMRLRGLSPEDKKTFKFQLESFYRSKDILRDTNDTNALRKELDEFHGKTSKFFYEILAERLKRKIGVFEDE